MNNATSFFAPRAQEIEFRPAVRAQRICQERNTCLALQRNCERFPGSFAISYVPELPGRSPALARQQFPLGRAEGQVVVFEVGSHDLNNTPSGECFQALLGEFHQKVEFAVIEDMDIQDVRRANLRLLIERRGLATLAKQAKKPDRQLNDMVAGRKSFGEKVARMIESNLQLEPRMLDAPLPASIVGERPAGSPPPNPGARGFDPKSVGNPFDRIEAALNDLLILDGEKDEVLAVIQAKYAKVQAIHKAILEREHAGRRGTDIGPPEGRPDLRGSGFATFEGYTLHETPAHYKAERKEGSK